MEPFISRDGKFLFFNNHNTEQRPVRDLLRDAIIAPQPYAGHSAGRTSLAFSQGRLTIREAKIAAA